MRSLIKLSLAAACLLTTSSLAFALETSTLTCQQLQVYLTKHGQTMLTTGRASGNYSPNYAECGGTIPGYVRTQDVAFCYAGWWCDDNYSSSVNPSEHFQGVDPLTP